MPRHHSHHVDHNPDLPPFTVTSSSIQSRADAKDERVKGRLKRQCAWQGQGHTDLSPSLAFHNIPEGTETLALTMVDIDAPEPFTHWVVLNIPATTTSLPEGFSVRGGGKDRAKGGEEVQEGVNDFKVPHYSGPNPPNGSEHRYVIKVYALDGTINIGNKATREKLEEAVEGHVLAEAEVVGTYSHEKKAEAFYNKHTA